MIMYIYRTHTVVLFLISMCVLYNFCSVNELLFVIKA